MSVSIDRQDPASSHRMPRAECYYTDYMLTLFNLNDIATALQRSPIHIFNYLAAELDSTCTRIEGDMYQIQTALDEDVQEMIYDYVDRFVICPLCDDTFTDWRINSDGLYEIECYDCGYECAIVPGNLT
jgi:translation initiation factor 2 beta subunit (eIF-2beta)/eIF-5